MRNNGTITGSWFSALSTRLAITQGLPIDQFGISAGAGTSRSRLSRRTGVVWAAGLGVAFLATMGQTSAAQAQRSCPGVASATRSPAMNYLFRHLQAPSQPIMAKPPHLHGFRAMFLV